MVSGVSSLVRSTTAVPAPTRGRRRFMQSRGRLQGAPARSVRISRDAAVRAAAAAESELPTVLARWAASFFPVLVASDGFGPLGAFTSVMPNERAAGRRSGLPGEGKLPVLTNRILLAARDYK